MCLKLGKSVSLVRVIVMSFVVTCDVTVKLWVYIFSVQNCDMEKLLSLQIIFFLDYSVTFYYSHST